MNLKITITILSLAFDELGHVTVLIRMVVASQQCFILLRSDQRFEIDVDAITQGLQMPGKLFAAVSLCQIVRPGLKVFTFDVRQIPQQKLFGRQGA